MEQRKYDLEERLINFTCLMIDIVEMLPSTRTGNYLAGQMIRCCHSPSFNYGEAQAAESRNDFIHKMKIVLKELKECRIGIKIIERKKLIGDISILMKIKNETEQLIAILAKSIQTTVKNSNNT